MVKIAPFNFTVCQSRKKFLWSIFFPKHKNEKCAAGDLQSLCGCAFWQPYQCHSRKSRSLIIWGYALFTNSVAGDFQTRDYSPQHMKKKYFFSAHPSKNPWTDYKHTIISFDSEVLKWKWEQDLNKWTCIAVHIVWNWDLLSLLLKATEKTNTKIQENRDKRKKLEVLEHQSPLATAISLTAGVFCVSGGLLVIVKDYLSGRSVL